MIYIYKGIAITRSLSKVTIYYTVNFHSNVGNAFILCADVFSSSINSEDIFNFRSPHVDIIIDIILKITKHLAATEQIPKYVMEHISRPIYQNGLHILNPSRSAISASYVPLLRSLYISKHGIPFDDINISLPKSIHRIYMNWK